RFELCPGTLRPANGPEGLEARQRVLEVARGIVGAPRAPEALPPVELHAGKLEVLRHSVQECDCLREGRVDLPLCGEQASHTSELRPRSYERRRLDEWPGVTEQRLRITVAAKTRVGLGKLERDEVVPGSRPGDGS